MADDVGRRLANFFWRIWSNESIRDHITGSQVAMLFSRISEGGVLRTTPTQSPRISRSLRSYRIQSGTGPGPGPDPVPPSPPPLASASVAEALPGEGRGNIMPTKGPTDPPSRSIRLAPTSQNVPDTAGLPPSKLKKPKPESASQGSGSTRDLSTRFDYPEQDTSRAGPTHGSVMSSGGEQRSLRLQEPSSSRGGHAASPTSTARSSSSQMKGAEGLSESDSGQKSGPRRPTVYAKSAVSKRRPSMPRQRSSQSSTGNNSTITSPPVLEKSLGASKKPATSAVYTDESLRRTESRDEDYPGSGGSHLPQDPQPRSAQFPPMVGIQDDRLSSGHDSFKDELVDRNFRTKFASRLQPDRQSLAPPAPYAYKSSTAAATSALYQATGTIGSRPPNPSGGKGKRNVAFTDEITPLEPSTLSMPIEEEEEEEEVAEQVDDNQPSVLPRTKSQLTLLLEKDKRTRGDEVSQRKVHRS